MAKLPSAFNAEEHEEMGDYGVMPKGKYNVKIVDSDYVENSKKTGHILKIIREVTEGEYKGRKIYSNLNLDNPNPTAVEIAQKEFTSTCKACGKIVVEDSEELHGIEHTIELGVKKGKGDEPDSNNILKIEPLEGAATPAKPGGAGSSSGEAPKRRRKKPVFEDDEE